jgi:hypothetical protein
MQALEDITRRIQKFGGLGRKVINDIIELGGKFTAMTQ